MENEERTGGEKRSLEDTEATEDGERKVARFEASVDALLSWKGKQALVVRERCEEAFLALLELRRVHGSSFLINVHLSVLGINSDPDLVQATLLDVFALQGRRMVELACDVFEGPKTFLLVELLCANDLLHRYVLNGNTFGASSLDSTCELSKHVRRLEERTKFSSGQAAVTFSTSKLVAGDKGFTPVDKELQVFTSNLVKQTTRSAVKANKETLPMIAEQVRGELDVLLNKMDERAKSIWESDGCSKKLDLMEDIGSVLGTEQDLMNVMKESRMLRKYIFPIFTNNSDRKDDKVQKFRRALVNLLGLRRIASCKTYTSFASVLTLHIKQSKGVAFARRLFELCGLTVSKTTLKNLTSEQTTHSDVPDPATEP